MQSSRRLCLLCRGAAHPLVTPFAARRAASSRATSTYDASVLVLDLDADDSKYVRRYEDIRQTKPVKNFMIDEDDLKFKQRPRPREKKAWEKLQEVPDSSRILGIDLLKYSLVQNPWRRMSSETSYLRKTLTMNGLSPRLGTFKEHAGWLVAVSKNPYLAHTEGDTSEMAFCRFKIAVRNSQSLYAVNRLVTLFTASRANCVELSTKGWILTDAIVVDRRKGNISATRSLKFINTVVQKLQVMGMDPGLHLCDAGMYYAAKTRQHATLRRYIALAVKYKYPPSSHRVKALGLAALRVNMPPVHEGDGVYSGQTSEKTRNDILTLTTGWGTNGVPRKWEQRQPCFGLLLGDDPAMIQRYLLSIAELGATASLSHEFHTGKTLTPAEYSSGLEELRSRVVSFVDVSIRGKNPIQAFEFLDYARKQTPGSEGEKPAILDLLDPERWKAVRDALHFYYEATGYVERRVEEDLAAFGLYSPEYVDAVRRLLERDGDGVDEAKDSADRGTAA